MTMMQKMQAKKSKKGFTLVELVIVIAILAILAAIAIPVITTTINSAKMSTMQSDATTIDMVLKDAVNNSLAKISTTMYGTKPATNDTLKVSEVLSANDLSATLLGDRAIGGKHYAIGWNGEAVKIYESSAAMTDALGNALIKDLMPSGSKGKAVTNGGTVMGTTSGTTTK